jgi:hypothetical protein
VHSGPSRRHRRRTRRDCFALRGSIPSSSPRGTHSGDLRLPHPGASEHGMACTRALCVRKCENRLNYKHATHCWQIIRCVKIVKNNLHGLFFHNVSLVVTSLFLFKKLILVPIYDITNVLIGCANGHLRSRSSRIAQKTSRIAQIGCANGHLRSRFVTDVTLHPLRISKVKIDKNNLHGLLFYKSVTHGDVTISFPF